MFLEFIKSSKLNRKRDKKFSYEVIYIRLDIYIRFYIQKFDLKIYFITKFSEKSNEQSISFRFFFYNFCDYGLFIDFD